MLALVDPVTVNTGAQTSKSEMQIETKGVEYLL
jgi:hypothetical protein